MGRLSAHLQPGAQPPSDAHRVGHAVSANRRTRGEELLNTLYRTITHEFSDMPWDALPAADAARTYVAAKKPRLLFVGYGETDEWAHNGRYDLVLQSAHNVDGFIRELWDDDAGDAAVPGPDDVHRSRPTTAAATGPRTGSTTTGTSRAPRTCGSPSSARTRPPLGERRNAARVTQSQIAATVAALLGKDWRSVNPKAGAPLGEAIGR